MTLFLGSGWAIRWRTKSRCALLRLLNGPLDLPPEEFVFDILQWRLRRRSYLWN